MMDTPLDQHSTFDHLAAWEFAALGLTNLSWEIPAGLPSTRCLTKQWPCLLHLPSFCDFTYSMLAPGTRGALHAWEKTSGSRWSGAHATLPQLEGAW